MKHSIATFLVVALLQQFVTAGDVTPPLPSEMREFFAQSQWDTSAHPEYFTEKGKRVVARMASRHSHSVPTSAEVTFWKIVYEGKKCFQWEKISDVDGKSQIAIVYLYQNDRWLCDDFFIEVSDGVAFQVYASDCIDRPIRTGFAENWNLIKRSWRNLVRDGQ